MIFVIVGLIGVLWLLPWMLIVKAPPKSHPWLTEEERQYILSGQKVTEEHVSDEEYNPTTKQLLKHKESWGVIIASAVIDPIWWLFVVWIPIYLNEVYGMDVKGIGLYGWVPYVGAMLGAWFGGLLAQNRIKSGWTVDKTRKLVITLGCLKTVGTLSGFSGMAAKLGAVGLTALVPWLTTGGNYYPVFVIGAAFSIIALLSIWGLCPKIEPLKAKK